MKSENKIAQLCFTYDQAQERARDPESRANQEYYLAVMGAKRTAIDVLLDDMLSRVGSALYDGDVSALVVELTYFNTWFNRRGGWL
jgi:hypothetical protein